MSSPKNKMGPAPRVLVGNYHKTLCLIHGESNIGKSSLAQLLLNDSLEYLSSDVICLDSDGNIQSLLDQCKRGTRYDFGAVAVLIEQHCAKRFVDFLFTKYILNSIKENIILDSFLFSLPICRSILYQLCLRNNVRVWEVRRLV